MGDDAGRPTEPHRRRGSSSERETVQTIRRRREVIEILRYTKRYSSDNFYSEETKRAKSNFSVVAANRSAIPTTPPSVFPPSFSSPSSQLPPFSSHSIPLSPPSHFSSVLPFSFPNPGESALVLPISPPFRSRSLPAAPPNAQRYSHNGACNGHGEISSGGTAMSSHTIPHGRDSISMVGFTGSHSLVYLRDPRLPGCGEPPKQLPSPGAQQHGVVSNNDRHDLHSGGGIRSQILGDAIT